MMELLEDGTVVIPLSSPSIRVSSTEPNEMDSGSNPKRSSKLGRSTGRSSASLERSRGSPPFHRNLPVSGCQISFQKSHS